MTLLSEDLWFINDDLWRLCVCDAYNAVIQCDLYDFIKDNEITSFNYFSYDDVKIQNKFTKLSQLADVRGLHSGASYSFTLRTVDNIIKNGFLNWKYAYIEKHHPHIVDKVFLIQKKFKNAISDPNYKMCKKRLEKEYFELIV